MKVIHGYCNLVVKNDNFTLLLTSSGKEWQFHIATDIYLRMVHMSTESSGQNESYTWLLTSSGQEWQFHMSTDI